MSIMHSLYNYKIHLETILCIYLLTNIFILGCCILFLVAVFDNYFDNYFLFAIFNKDLFDQKYKYTLQDNTSNNVDDTIIQSSMGQWHILGQWHMSDKTCAILILLPNCFGQSIGIPYAYVFYNFCGWFIALKKCMMCICEFLQQNDGHIHSQKMSFLCWNTL